MQVGSAKCLCSQLHTVRCNALRDIKHPVHNATTHYVTQDNAGGQYIPSACALTCPPRYNAQRDTRHYSGGKVGSAAISQIPVLSPAHHTTTHDVTQDNAGGQCQVPVLSPVHHATTHNVTPDKTRPEGKVCSAAIPQIPVLSPVLLQQEKQQHNNKHETNKTITRR